MDSDQNLKSSPYCPICQCKLSCYQPKRSPQQSTGTVGLKLCCIHRLNRPWMQIYPILGCRFMPSPSNCLSSCCRRFHAAKRFRAYLAVTPCMHCCCINALKYSSTWPDLCAHPNPTLHNRACPIAQVVTAYPALPRLGL